MFSPKALYKRGALGFIEAVDGQCRGGGPKRLCQWVLYIVYVTLGTRELSLGIL